MPIDVKMLFTSASPVLYPPIDTFAFDKASTSQDWLYNCRQTILADVLKPKVDQRNLILVTHSECIDQLENH